MSAAKNLKEKKQQELEEFLKIAQQVKMGVDATFQLEGFPSMFAKDVQAWTDTFKFPSSKELHGFLRRLFVVIRHGGLLFKPQIQEEKQILHACKHCQTDWKYFGETGWPLAATMSHGGRIVIQLPKSKGSDDGHEFWKWLVSGSEYGFLQNFVSTSLTGEQCAKDSKIIFKRIGATHSIEYYKNNNVITPDDEGGYYFHLPGGRKKYIKEVKTMGINFRDTKMLRGEDHNVFHHRHWGCNVPMGGNGQTSCTGKIIQANGEHGHLYIYYQSSKTERYGGIMIGLEGSEYQKYDNLGGYHSFKAESSDYSPTLGYKWFNKKHGEKSLNKYVNGPGKYDSMFLDLSGFSLSYFKDREKEWDDSMLGKTPLTHEEIKYLQESVLIAPRIVTRTPAKPNRGLPVVPKKQDQTEQQTTTTTTTAPIEKPKGANMNVVEGYFGAPSVSKHATKDAVLLDFNFDSPKSVPPLQQAPVPAVTSPPAKKPPAVPTLVMRKLDMDALIDESYVPNKGAVTSRARRYAHKFEQLAAKEKDDIAKEHRPVKSSNTVQALTSPRASPTRRLALVSMTAAQTKAVQESLHGRINQLDTE